MLVSGNFFGFDETFNLVMRPGLVISKILGFNNFHK